MFGYPRRVPVSSIRIGDLVDLENDPYADPQHDNPTYPYEYVVCCEIEHETPWCIVLGFEGAGGVVGFPPDHDLMVGGHTSAYDEDP